MSLPSYKVRLIHTAHEWAEVATITAFGLVILALHRAETLSGNMRYEDGHVLGITVRVTWSPLLFKFDLDLAEIISYVFVFFVVMGFTRSVEKRLELLCEEAHFLEPDVEVGTSRVNFSLNIADADGQFDMRTLRESAIETILPGKIERRVLRNSAKALQNAHPTPDWAPFLRLPRDKVGRIRQQVINKISELFGVGHVAMDMGLETMTATYVWGVTYEITNPAIENRKLRLLLVREDMLNIVRKMGNRRPPYPDGLPDNARQYYEKRTAHLKLLAKYYFTSSESDTSLARRSEKDEYSPPKLRSREVGGLKMSSQASGLSKTQSGRQPYLYEDENLMIGRLHISITGSPRSTNGREVWSDWA